MSILNEQENKTKVEVKQISGRIGAVVSGIELSGSLDAETTKIVQDALLKHKVLFFRNQTHLTDSEQEAFARLLGEPISHPTVPVKEGTKHILELE
ncbi:TauD/TfdA dioxygenase family protein [Alkalihalobacillus sp. 1P02AB]|uniref:TauD/TfdA dioxygenase family protein n=1 Tax=Alkalihalobacillus sp. 1P02AB TaxID=3132260 RepID=UPI0039A57842